MPLRTFDCYFCECVENKGVNRVTNDLRVEGNKATYVTA